MKDGIELQSPYKRGAEDGVVFGIYLSIMVFAMIFAMRVPLLNLLFVVQFVMAPVLIYVMQRRYYVSERGFTTKSALWMQGLVMCGCGSLIAFGLSFVYMRWINPGYLDNTFVSSIQMMKQSGIADCIEFADEMEKVTGGHYPMSAIEFNMSMIWFVTLVGSITSLLLSFLVSWIPIKQKK
ncbi:MAG: DUF4199 domain-containing protein [Muribaculaceae bacterium]|nr:DUF4199 domain-containing protein [Muribaculaceae bacterium]